MCLEPALDAQGRFPEPVVAQEAENLAHRIEGLLNDKGRYAAMRCIEEMCRGEAYALPAHGRLEDLPTLDPARLTDRWRKVLETAPVDVFAVGGGPALEDLVARHLAPLAGGAAREVGTVPGRAPAEPRVVREHEAVEQGKLCLGYRTGITRRDRRHPAMRMYAGILGGFPHSKLFRNVRERASLAYSASADWDGHKGILMVHAGIEADAYAQAVEIIRQQVDAMAAGRIDDDELEFTRRGLANHMREAADSTYGLLNSALGLALVDDLRPLRERLAAIAAVTRQDVVEAAQSVRLDTIYFLSAEGGSRYG
jgi:predicted Zn-dependent peptidase